MRKTYPADIHNEIMAISNELDRIFKSNNSNLRTIAKFSGLSVNSVKAVLTGHTANIASYLLVAKALGRNFTSIVASLNANTSATTDNKQACTSESSISIPSVKV